MYQHNYAIQIFMLHILEKLGKLKKMRTYVEGRCYIQLPLDVLLMKLEKKIKNFSWLWLVKNNDQIKLYFVIQIHNCENFYNTIIVIYQIVHQMRNSILMTMIVDTQRSKMQRKSVPDFSEWNSSFYAAVRHWKLMNTTMPLTFHVFFWF